MINSSSKPHRKKAFSVIIILLILSVLIFIYKDSTPVAFLSGTIQQIFSGPKGFIYALGKNENSHEISDLKRKNEQLVQRIADYEQLKNENIALRSQFAISGDTSPSLVATRIIGFQGSGKFPEEFIVNVGENDGIKKGMSVIFQKYLVGKVEQVGQKYSVVVTPFSQKFKILAKLTTTGANGLLIGQNDFMLLQGVLITDTLSKDAIVTSKGEVDGEGIGVLPDIIIGKVVSVSKNETAPFQSAQVQTVIDFSKLTNVFIIAKL